MRLCAALLIDPPQRDEIDGLRRGLGGAAGLGRIAPHVTVVPPVNVASAGLRRAQTTLRAAAGSAPGPLHLELGPVATFAPANPVLYLQVGGDLHGLARLRARLLAPPLSPPSSRPDLRPFVPHVTLGRATDPVWTAAAIAALACYRMTVACDRVVLLAERSDAGGRRWVPWADAALLPAAVVGRGGLPLELTRGRLVDPEAAALLPPEAAALLPAGAAGTGPAGEGAGDGAGDGRRIVVTARREAEVVGVAVAWVDDDGGQVAVVVDPACRGQGIGSHLLAAVESDVASAGWSCTTLAAHGPAAWYRRRGRFSVAAG